MNIWISIALRNLMRNTRRTILTACIVLVGTLVITLTDSWISGIFGGMMDRFTAASGHIRLVTEEFHERRALHPLYENIPDADVIVNALMKIPGVVAAEPRISAGVIVSVGEEIGDDFAMLSGMSDKWYREHFNAEELLYSGEWLSGVQGEVVLGRRIARQVGAEVGESVLLLGQTQDGAMSPLSAVVTGIFGGDAMLEMQAFTTLEDMRWLTDMEGAALEMLVYAASRRRQEVAAVHQRILESNQAELSGLVLIPWYEDETFAGMMSMVEGIRKFIAFLMVLVTALAIFNTMTMSVMERTDEIGVMRAMGMTRLGVMAMFVFEATVIGLLGGFAGTGLGAVGAAWLKEHGITLSAELVDKMGSGIPIQTTLYGELNAQILLNALLLGVVMAVAGVLIPAFRAGRISPVEAMREHH